MRHAFLTMKEFDARHAAEYAIPLAVLALFVVNLFGLGVASKVHHVGSGLF